jgi:predicted metalloendopeptidase
MLMPLPVLALALALTVVLAACRPADPEAVPSAPALDLKEVSAAVSEALDPAANPCDDFYRYACGGWIDHTPLPADQARWGRSFSPLLEGNRQVLREILEGASETAASDPDAALIGAYYGSCMNEAARQAQGIEALEPWLQEIRQVEDPETLMTVVGKLQRVGVPALFDLGILPDFKNPDRYMSYYDQGGLGLPERDFYLREDETSVGVRQAYVQHIQRMFELTGEAADSAAAAAQQILSFETELARASRPAAEMRNLARLYNKLDLAGLKEIAPDLPWDAYQAAIGSPSVSELVVTVPPFFEALNALVKGSTSENLQRQLYWTLLRATAPVLTPALEAESFELSGKVLAGRQEMEPQWKRCADSTDGALGEALGRLFVHRTFPGDSKEIALGMIRRVEHSLESNFPNLSWMDDITRERAKEKLAAIQNKIGYPDEWRDYSSLKLTDTSYFANALAANRFEFDRTQKQLQGPVDRKEWGMTPATVNAYYNPTLNEIVFPAGILQPPIFHRDYPASMNYGAMGAVVGHELTHGFDDSGRRFDAKGRLEEWWEPEVAGRFEERAQCIDDLYSSYEVQPGLTINGKLTLGENIADLGGVKASYNAFKEQVGEGLRQPSAVSSLTNEQLFFVSYGQVWCAISTPEFDRLQVQSDPHSAPKYRVNGPLSNLPAFAEAFSCPQGSPMRRQPACEVW